MQALTAVSAIPSNYLTGRDDSNASVYRLFWSWYATEQWMGQGQTGTLKVVKHVVNDNGGTLAAGDFSLHVLSGGGDVAGSPQAGSETGTVYTLGAGQSYEVSEDAVSGYSASYSSDCKGTIAHHTEKVCTVTNDDQLASLTLDKVMQNDNGGTAKESEWTLTATGPTTISGPGATGHSDVVSGSDFKAGTYTLSESGGSADYKESAWSCVTNEGAAVEGDSIDIGPGDSVVCTITNDDKPAYLKIIKHVVNDDGGSKSASDFTLTIGGVVATGGQDVTGAEAPGVTKQLAWIGSYTVTEADHAGYDVSYSSDCAGTIGLGETKTCTVTNDDQPTNNEPPPTSDQSATLTVIKKVVNDNGGTAVPSDFTMTVTGADPKPASFAGSASGTTVSIGAGAFAVGESGPGGYEESRSTGGCSGTISLGQHLVCTITNDDVPVTPPPVTPPSVPPAPQVDLSLTKGDAPDPVALGNQIVYTLTITNKVLSGSSDPATNVTLADPLPSGLTFGSANASQGTCAIAGDGLTCDIGTMAPGAVVTVRLVATPATTGTVTNTAVVTSAETDLDPADNTASATTDVQAPFTPPAPPATTPKPKAVAPTCARVTVTPLTLKVGSKTVVVVKVRDQKGKPLAKASVTLRGPGILVRGKTNANGVYKRTLAPKKPGMVVVRVPGPAACIGKLGVVGTFQPPVTG